MAGSHVVSTLDAPWDVLDGCAGVGLDIGGSVIKITYIDKDDWVDPANRIKGSRGKIRFASFSREHLDQAYKFIKMQAHIARKSPDEEIEIFTTGVGGSQLASDIRKELNVRSQNLTEFDCFVHSFIKLLKTYSRREIIYEPHKPAYQTARRDYDNFARMLEKMEGLTAMDITQDHSFEYTFLDDPKIQWHKPMVEDKDIFPCFLVMLGSGFGTILIKEDGSFLAVDGSNRGGRMFLGQGALMTGVKTYEELMALCEKGEARGVTTTTVHLSEGIKEDEQDIYNTMKDMDEWIVYCFGQAVGKDRDDLKKEDIMRGLLQTFALDIAQTNHLLAHLWQVKHVFFCGSFLQHHLVREEIITEWLRRDVPMSSTNPLMKGKQTYCHFLKQGPHLGSLGAFLNSKFHFHQPSPAESSGQPVTKEEAKATSQKDTTTGKTASTSHKDVTETKSAKKVTSYKAGVGL